MKDSFSFAMGALALVGTIMAVTGVTLPALLPGLGWWVYFLLVVALFAVCFAGAAVVLYVAHRKSVALKVGSNDVLITQGDLFKMEGWKVIPFNERYDTIVDDVVISRSSLNGAFILNHVTDLESLHACIDGEENSRLSVSVQDDGNKLYELGYIKRFDGEYLLLALTHFNEQNEAYLTIADYEACLLNMWSEISRAYAGMPVNIPLLGSGITRFDGVTEKTSAMLLRCMLCTLRASGKTFTNKITFVLKNEALKELNLYEMKNATWLS